MKAIKYIAIGLGSFLGIRYLLGLNRAKDKININVSGQKDSITAQGITLLVKYNIQNPTRAKLKLTPPLIKLSVNGKLIASSAMQSVEIPQNVKDQSGRIIIEAFKETGIITTKILVPWLAIAAISPTLVTRLQSTDPKDKIKIEVETISQVYTLAGDYPYEDVSTIEL
jgi:hypothetical protein